MFKELRADLLRRLTDPVKRELHQAVDNEIARLEAACDAAIARFHDGIRGAGSMFAEEIADTMRRSFRGRQ